MAANLPLEYLLININNYEDLGISKYDTVGIKIGANPTKLNQLVLTTKEPYFRKWTPDIKDEIVGVIIDIKKPEPIKSTIFDIIHS